MTLEDKLQRLRIEWVKAPVTKRKILEMRAKLVKMAIDRRDEITEKNVQDLIIN